MKESRRLKVLQVGKFYPPARGGMETHLQQICQMLKDKVDLKVVVANSAQNDLAEVVEGVEIMRLSTAFNVAGAPVCLGLPSAIRNAEADIVHIHVPHPTALMSYLISGCRSRLVCTYHSDIVRQRFLGSLVSPVQEMALSRASVIIATSPNIALGSRVLAKHAERTIVIPLGVDPKPYEVVNTAAVAAIREKHPGRLILGVGRLVTYKGFDVLIKSMAHLPADVELLLIGEGPLRSQLTNDVRHLGLETRVHILGEVDDVISYFQACDLFLLPSVGRNEAFGLVQLEAMAAGKAVINTSLKGSGVSYVSRDGESGLTVPPGDVYALTRAITQLLSDTALRERFGRAGRDRVAQEFTLAKMNDRLLDCYDDVLRL